jgi:hypothetical protein
LRRCERYEQQSEQEKLFRSRKNFHWADGSILHRVESVRPRGEMRKGV